MCKYVYDNVTGKTQKSKYFEKETLLFLRIKKYPLCISRCNMVKKMLVEVILKRTYVN